MSQATSGDDVGAVRGPISHEVHGHSSERMRELDDESVHLVVTSPPYWNIKDYGNEDQIGFNESLQEYISRLRRVWSECYRVLKPGCRMVVNIGDQYHRAQDGKPYQITPLNAHIINSILDATQQEILFLGSIIWQKVSNTETSGGACVMGSYGRPRNGYVSYDYEYVNIFRKPGSDPDVPDELKSHDGIEKEEWKELFNGHWQFPGARQDIHSAPFPEELPRRAIRMFTFTGDRVLDPFLGRGTTMAVADNMGRSSVGYETGFEPPNGGRWENNVREYLTSDAESPERFSFNI